MHHSQIFPVHSPFLQLLHQGAVRGERLRHDQQATGVLVQAVNNARAWYRRQCRVMVQQRILQGTVPITHRRVHDQPGRFVDHQQLVVLIDPIHLNRLRPDFRFYRQFSVDFNRFTTGDTLLRLTHSLVDFYLTTAQPLLQAAARIVRKQLRQHPVNPGTRLFQWYFAI